MSKTYTIEANAITRAVVGAGEITTLPPSAAHRDVSVMLFAGKATDKKMEALNKADAVAVVAISHGTGSVAKAARELKTNNEFDGVVQSVGYGNLQAFALIVAAKLGECVKFQKRIVEDEVVSTASDAFKDFGGVLRHKMLQLEAKGKVYNAKGGYTAAAADLAYLLSLHKASVAVMNERDTKDAARRAALAAEREADAQARIQMDKGADVEEIAVI